MSPYLAVLAGLLLAMPVLAAPVHLWTRADASLPLLREAAQRFSQRTGIAVEVSAPPGMLDRFQALAQNGQGPDLLIWAHDRVGEWVEMGLLAPVPASPVVSRQLLPQGWQGFYRAGQHWGWPLMLEAPSLIINRAHVQQAPRSLAEVDALRPQLLARGVAPLKWEYMNAYYSWPMLDPGLTVLAPAGQLRPAAVAEPAVVQRLQQLQRWMAAGNMPFSADYIDMEREFNRGQLAMMIAGPWAFDNLRRSRIDFELAPVPGLDGQPVPSFVGVVGVMLNAHSTQAHAARKFVEEVLLDPAIQQHLYRAHGMAGVPSHKQALRALWSDRLLRQQVRLIHRGVLMPSDVRMRQVWSTLGSALFNMGYGRQTPAEALQQAASRLTAP